MFLGKDVEFKCLQTTTSSALTTGLSEWIRLNPDVNIIDIKYCVQGYVETAFIIYEKGTAPRA